MSPKRKFDYDWINELAYFANFSFSRSSRLACQVVVNEKMEGMVVYIPDGPSSDFV